MNTAVILGAGCSKGLANLPVDIDFMDKFVDKIYAQYFIKEDLWPAIMNG